MTELSMNAEGVYSRGPSNSMVNFDSQRCEGQCSIELADMLAKMCRKGASTTEEITKSGWWFWKNGKSNLALETAHSKLLVTQSGGGELLSIEVKCMTVLTLNIHKTG